MSDLEIINIFYTDKGKINPHLTKEKYLNNHIEIKNYLLNRFNDSNSIIETIYRIKNNIEKRPICKVCGGPLYFQSTRIGFRNTCSISCAKHYVSETNTIYNKNIILNDIIENGKLNNNKLQDQYLKNHGYYDFLMSLYDDSISKAEIIYRLYHNIKSRPVCKECGKPSIFLNFNDGYSKFCNNDCKIKNSYNRKISDKDIVELLFNGDRLNTVRLEEPFLKNFHIYDYLINRYKDSTSITETVYRIKNDIEKRPICQLCGSPSRFIKFSVGFANTCNNSICVKKYNEQQAEQIQVNDNYIIDNVDYRLCRKHNLILNGLYDYIINRYYDSSSITENVYRIKNHIEERPVCQMCGKAVRFISPTKGYKKFCSFQCTMRNKTISHYRSIGLHLTKIENNQYFLKNGCSIHGDLVLNHQTFFRRLQNNQCLCKKCNPFKYSSIEKKIANILDDFDIKYIFHDRQHIYPYELDLFLPDYNIGIECNGIYWHNIFNIEKDQHYRKFKICKENGIKLITLWEDQINNKIEIIKKYILKLCKPIIIKDYEIKEIKQPTQFIIDNCIEAFKNMSTSIGLFRNDVMIACMSFRKYRDQYMIHNYCTKDNYIINNGFVNMINYFIDHYCPNQILYIENNDITIENIDFEKIGFKLKEEKIIQQKHEKHFCYNSGIKLYIKHSNDTQGSI